MLATSVIELHQSALKTNLDYLQGLFGPGVQYSSVVKGNAYGHGISEFVPMAEELGVRHFSVFSADEALEALQASQNSEIMIMGHIDNAELEWAVSQGVSFFVFERDRLEGALAAAKKVGKPAKIHLEVETGLNRTGFNQSEMEQVCPMLIRQADHLALEGLCTHYAGAESVANHVRVIKQIERFETWRQWLSSKNIQPRKLHTACSAAAMSYPQSRMNMVRIGILQYGFWPSRETFIHCIRKNGDWQDPLKRVISWKSRVMDVKEVHTGEFVGYGTTFMASDHMKIATVPVGYSHGYSRSLSNQGRVLIRGKRLAVIGMVNMNLLIVDVSECAAVRKGDEVVLIGEQEGHQISVSSFSELSDQLNYELLTRLPRNIPRKVIPMSSL